MLALAAIGIACGGGDGPAAPARPTFVLSAASAAPLSLVTGTVGGRALPASGLRARVGGDTAIVTRLDDSTITILVPSATPSGPQPVSVIAGADTLLASLQVIAAAAIADPTAYVTAALDGVSPALDAIEAGLTGADAVVLDTAQVRADVRRARALGDSARRALAAATPAQRAAVAQFLAANAVAFGLVAAPTAASARSVMLLPDAPVGQSSEGSIKCFDGDSGAALRTWEECGSAQVIFGRGVRTRIAILAGGAAIAAIADLSGVGTLLGLVGGAIIAREVIKLTVAVVKTAWQTTVAKFEEQLELAAVRAQVVAAEPDPEYFVKDRGRALRVRATYRSLQASDLGVPGVGVRAVVMRGLESLLNRARSLLLMGPLAALVPTTARASIVDDVPTQYLRLGAVTASVVGTSSVADSGFVVRFGRAGATADIPFSFELGYAAPGLPLQEKDIASVLIPTPRFMAQSLLTGKMGDRMCAIDVNGAAFCWGRNPFGRLGDLTTTDRALPTRTRTGLGLSSLTGGDSHTCGLTSAGAAECWGYYALGDTTKSATDGRLTSAPVRTSAAFSSLVAGRSEACGLSGGRAICWGAIVFTFDTAGTSGRARIAELPNALPFSPGFASIDVGAQFACGVTSTQAVQCFGLNRHAQLGDGTTTTRGQAVTVAGGRTWKAVSVGDAHACALTTAGAAYCWGANTFGQIGDGFASAGSGAGYTPVPAAVAGGLTFAQIESGSTHTCALTESGKAYCWGDDASGQTGSATSTGQLQNVPAPVATTVLFRSLSAGNHLTCGIARTGGGVYCWGSNTFGEAGIGAASNNVPVSAVVPPQG